MNATGRWHGRITRRPLLHGDATVDALTNEERAELADVWLARAATERRVADSFAVIRDALAELEAESALVALAERAIDDEYRHAEICRFVASRFADHELASPPLLPLRIPQHRGAPRTLELSLWVVGQCCMNETIASAFLEAAFAKATGPMARGALRELLSDEVDHARLGWAFLAALSEVRREEISPWLLGMLRKNLELWRDAPRDYSMTETTEAQGAPTAATVQTALDIAIRDLIIPGFRQLAMPTERLERWADAGAPL